jgi:formate hydrogenlyase transcriptional activator
MATMQEDGFAHQDWVLLGQIAGRVAVALENDRAYHEIAQLKNRLAEEKLYLEDEIRSELHFEEIIGESPVLKRVLSQAKTVAASEATVLILGGNRYRQGTDCPRYSPHEYQKREQLHQD